MGSVGNHDAANNFSQWRARFAPYGTLARRSGSSNSLWYSYNLGLVHFVHISTEVFAWGGGDPVAQQAWLDADLAAVNRSATPWIVVVGHKEAWMSAVDFSLVDRALRRHGVDVYVCGHQHNYQRVRPRDANGRPIACANAGATVLTDCGSYLSLVVGSAGNKEQLGLFGLQDRFEHAPDAALDALTVNNGFSRMTVVNATTLSFVFEVTGQRDDLPRLGRWDAFSLVKTTRA